jgi:hypothetical protein
VKVSTQVPDAVERYRPGADATFNYSGATMHITRLARITAATAGAITVIGVMAVPSAEAAAPGIRTYATSIHGTILIDSWGCNVTTHNYPGNPIDIITNKCPGRVWLHEEGAPHRTYCVSPGTSANFGGRWEVINVQETDVRLPC